MKVIFKLLKYSGGAPLSALQYASILKKNDCEVIAIAEGEDNESEERYEQAGIRADFERSFSLEIDKHNYIGAYKALCAFYDYLVREQPDVLIAMSDYFPSSYICRLLNIEVLSIIAGGNIFVPDFEAFLLAPPKHIICFSEENKDALLKTGYKPEGITVISNRISCGQDMDWTEHYKKDNDKINLLIMSRLVTGKLNSVKYTIRLAAWLAEQGVNVTLKVAGNGNCFDEMNEYAEAINEKAGKQIIEMLGFITNTDEEARKADIIFGKGRSVIEPVMCNRFGVVVGEDNKMSICTNQSFDNLYHYNFSGRNIEHNNSFEDILELINSIRECRIDHDEFYRCFDTVRSYYSAELLGEKFYSLFREKIAGNKTAITPKRYHKALIVIMMLRYLAVRYISKLTRRGGNK